MRICDLTEDKPQAQIPSQRQGLNFPDDQVTQVSMSDSADLSRPHSVLGAVQSASAAPAHVMLTVTLPGVFVLRLCYR